MAEFIKPAGASEVPPHLVGKTTRIFRRSQKTNVTAGSTLISALPAPRVFESVLVQQLHYTPGHAYVAEISDCRVLMYFGDHPPPHVHVVKGDGRDCIVEIETLLTIGKLASREVRGALEWIAEERQFLLSEWRRCNP